MLWLLGALYVGFKIGDFGGYNLGVCGFMVC